MDEDDIAQKSRVHWQVNATTRQYEERLHLSTPRTAFKGHEQEL